MNLKTLVTLSGALLASTAMTAKAELTLDVVNAYIFRGATLSDEVHVQPSFATGIFDDFAEVGVWGTFDTDASEFTEVDFTLSVPISLGEDSPVSLSVGYCEYMYPFASTNSVSADREVSLTLGTDLGPIGAELMVAYGIDGAVDKSLYAELTLSHTVDLGEIAVDLSAAAAYADPDAGESGFSHATFGVGTELFGFLGLSVAYITQIDDDVLVDVEDGGLFDEEVLVTVSATF